MTSSALSADELGNRLGLRRYPRSWRGECPACGYANTFTVKPGRNGRVDLFCASCRDRPMLADAIERRLGEGWKSPLPVRQSADTDKAAAARMAAAAERLWNGSEPAANSPAAAYLAVRGLTGLESSPGLRFRGDVTHPEMGGRWPAMVAQVVAVNGKHVGVHRTYLRPDGAGKAAIEPQKATLGPCWGGVVRLGQLAAEMVIGEGIESSASAGRLLGMPAWAALSAGNLAQGLTLPVGIRSVVIAADHDRPDRNGKRAGQDAAAAAAARWRAEGRDVRIALPDRPRSDFNDVLLERARG